MNMKSTPKHLRWSLHLLIFAALIVALTACQAAQTAPSQTATPAPTTAALDLSSDEESEQVGLKEEPIDCTLQIQANGDGFQYRAPCGNGSVLVFSFKNHRDGPDDPGVMYFYISMLQASDQWSETMYNVSWVALYGDNPSDMDIMHGQLCYALQGDSALDIPPRTTLIGDPLIQEHLKNNPCE